MNGLAGWGEGWLQAWAAGMERSLIQGSAALMLAWLLCRAGRSMPPGLQHWLWRIAYLKLILAFLVAPCFALRITVRAPVKAPLPGGGRAEQQPTPSPSTLLRSLRVRPKPRAAAEPGGAEYRLSPVTPPPRREPAVDPEGWLCGLWTMGVAASVARLGWERRTLIRLRSRARPVLSPGVRELLEAVCRELRLRRLPELLACDQVAAPLLLGMRRPALILPASLLAEGTPAHLRLIVAHELAHVRRRDLLWACLPTLARGLFFFHPLVWLAEREWRLTTEMACDAEVLATLPGSRPGYARLLLELATRPLNRDHASLQSAGLAESYPTLRRRLIMIRSYTRLPRRRLMLLYTLAAFGGGAFLMPWTVEARPAAAPVSKAPAARIPTPPSAPKSVERPVRPAATRVTRALPLESPPSNPAPGTNRPTSTPTSAGTRTSQTGAGATRSGSVPMEEPDRLDDQWEDVLILEALQYLVLSPAQLRQLAPLASFAAARQEQVRAEERRIRAELAGIVRENRAALLRGASGLRQEEAVRLDQRLKSQQAAAEAEIGRYVMPRLLRILTREQLTRVFLLAMGRPARDAKRPVGAALLDPASGFVFELRTVLEQRYSAPVVVVAEQVEKNLHGDSSTNLLLGTTAAARREHELIVNGVARALRNHGREWTEEELEKERMENWNRQFFGVGGVDARVQAAREERLELQLRPEPYVRQLASRGGPGELAPVVRLFAERLFLSPRLKPVLEERLRDLRGER